MDPIDINIKLRLHQELTEETLLRITDFIKSLQSERFIVAGEVDAKRTHYQCYINAPLFVGEDGDLKKAMKRIRNSFRYHYKDLIATMPEGKKGNSLYSITLISENCSFPLEYCAYLVKEGNYSIVGFSKEEVATILDHNARVVETRTEKELKKKKSQFAQVEESFEQILSLVHEEGEPIYHIDSSRLRQSGFVEPLSEYLITLFVVKYWKDQQLAVREFHMTSIVQTLSLKYMPHYTGVLVNRILDKITTK